MSFRFGLTFCITIEAQKMININMVLALRLLILGMAISAGFLNTSSRAQTNKIGGFEVNVTNDIKSGSASWSVNFMHADGAIDSNGLSCHLTVENQKSDSGLGVPVCMVRASNNSTNTFFLWAVYKPEYLNVELFDLDGRPIPKTGIENSRKNLLEASQLLENTRNRYKQWLSGSARTDGFVRISPQNDWPLSDFDISKMFVIPRPGEYTLKIRMPVIQRVGKNRAEPELKIIWLSEVITEIRLTEYLPQNNDVLFLKESCKRK